MAKTYRMPDFIKIYPEASKEVIAALSCTERKINYVQWAFACLGVFYMLENFSKISISTRTSALSHLADTAERERRMPLSRRNGKGVI